MKLCIEEQGMADLPLLSWKEMSPVRLFVLNENQQSIKFHMANVAVTSLQPKVLLFFCGAQVTQCRD